MADSDYYNQGTSVGADPPLKYNATKYKAQGIVKPSDLYTLATFRELQTQLNRLAGAKGSAKVATDGDIGPKTLALAKKLGVVPASTTPTQLAAQADVLGLKARGMADDAAAPPAVAPAPTAAAVLVDAIGDAVKVPLSMIPGSPVEAPRTPAPQPVAIAPPEPEKPRPAVIPAQPQVQVKPTAAEVVNAMADGVAQSAQAAYDTVPSLPEPPAKSGGGGALAAVGLGLFGMLGLMVAKKKRR